MCIGGIKGAIGSILLLLHRNVTFHTSLSQECSYLHTYGHMYVQCIHIMITNLIIVETLQNQRSNILFHHKVHDEITSMA